MWTWIKYGAGAAAALILLFTFSKIPSMINAGVHHVKDSVASTSPLFYNEKLALHWINQYRKENGLGPLQRDSRLTRAAQWHANYLASNDTISHEEGSWYWPFGWNSVPDRVKNTGYNPSTLGEIVTGGPTSFSDALDGWKKTDPLNAKLLASNATDIGIGVKKDTTGLYDNYWVILIASEKHDTGDTGGFWSGVNSVMPWSW